MSWYHQAECRTAPYEVFFPEVDGDGGSRHHIYARARTWCARCPVIEPCLAEALRFDVQSGFAGGKTPKEREIMKRKGIR